LNDHIAALLLVASCTAQQPRAPSISTPVNTLQDVPAGDYIVGCSDLRYCANKERFATASTTRSQATVSLSAFRIQRYAVSPAEYDECVAARACPAVRELVPTQFFTNSPAKVPISAAAAYCTWRSMRLPTEDEWEAAARGPDGRAFPWGRNDDHARHPTWGGVHVPTDVVAPAFVTRRTPGSRSPFGVEDLIGSEPEIVVSSRAWPHHVVRKGGTAMHLGDPYYNTAFYAEMMPDDGNGAFRCATGGASPRS
jgi:iron(II)-dependent oxidoreductase